MAWEVQNLEDSKVAADVISRVYLLARILKDRQRQLNLHADNSRTMWAATMEARLEELGVLRSFSRSRVSNDIPHSEALFRTANYRPAYFMRPVTSQE